MKSSDKWNEVSVAPPDSLTFGGATLFCFLINVETSFTHERISVKRRLSQK